MELGPAIHLAHGEHVAGVLRELIRLLDRHDEVVEVAGAFACGPLQDADEGGAAREAWCARFGASIEAGTFDDRQTWQRVLGDARPVVVCHGPHPEDRLLMLRACWQLRTQPARLYEVAVQNRVRTGPAFYDAVGIRGPNTLVDDWKALAPISDGERRAAAWEVVRSSSGDGVRELQGDSIVELAEDSHDAELLARCADWTRSTKVLGYVLADHPVAYSFLTWRLRTLIADGRLAARGEPTEHALPAEIRTRQP